MITLKIDGQRCDIEEIPAIPINFSSKNLTDVEGRRQGREVELLLPSTPLNDSLFGTSRDIYATSRFNEKAHNATLERDDVVIFEGLVHLVASTIKGGKSGYRIRICEGGAEWIEQVVNGHLSDLNIEFSGALNLSTITKSWGEDCAVRFLPVFRGNSTPGYSNSALPIEKVMLSDDYHPFISIAEMVKAMFANSGYRVQSQFLDSEFGRSLYMSGDYVRSDASQAKERCDFFARRSEPTTAKADFVGRVYASNSYATSTVGPIVDCVDPEHIDSEGVQMHETFSKNYSFSKNSAGNICFTPKYSVKAGFVLHLEYTTDYRILSRDNFVGFDVVEALNGVRVSFSLANTCRDFRNSVEQNMQYRALVFDHTEGRQYKLLATLNNSTYTMGQWSTRSAIVTSPSTKPTALHLYYRDSANSSWVEYTEDWALYAGYVEEEGRVDVVMDLRLPPIEVKAGSSYTFDKIWFGGAEQGMNITVGVGTTLRPYFTTVPGYNSSLTFKDIAPRHIRQSDLLAAIGEMFNLAFHTDKVSKELFIEPLESLYNRDEVVDIASRIDRLDGIEIVDSGLGAPQNTQFSYIDTDRASHIFNLENDTELGTWHHKLALYGTKKSTHTVRNRLFTTSLNVTNVLSSAPSASLVQIGDTNSEEQSIDATFTPHIVCYKGLRRLPDGECWIANEKFDHYPYATFVDEETNLCFEDRGGVTGLNSYYRDSLARLEKGQKATLNLYFTTAEITNLLTTYGSKPSVRSLFRFDINGESALYRLIEIEEWNITQSATIRCSFEREIEN